ncbi:MAG: recombination protein RecR [Planctomycetaceae bacterium]|nr:recombination protein RecR [Planctomycetaceae bacterium]
MSYPESVNTLIEEFSRMPGIGRRSAERLAFHVLKSSREEAMGLSDAIRRVKESVRHCSVCWNLADDDPCPICRDERRDASVVLVVEQPRDLISLEQTGMHGGVYHVLLGRLDPLDGVGPEGLTVDDLLARLRDPARNARGVAVVEVVLGLNPDMEGDTTALHVAEEARKMGIRTTRLARGLPSGSQIEYASRAVLADAITERRPLD